MGCHGNAQAAGAGFSFILKFQRLAAASPDTAGNVPRSQALARFKKLFHSSVGQSGAHRPLRSAPVE